MWCGGVAYGVMCVKEPQTTTERTTQRTHTHHHTYHALQNIQTAQHTVSLASNTKHKLKVSKPVARVTIGLIRSVNPTSNPTEQSNNKQTQHLLRTNTQIPQKQTRRSTVGERKPTQQHTTTKKLRRFSYLREYHKPNKPHTGI